MDRIFVTRNGAVINFDAKEPCTNLTLEDVLQSIALERRFFNQCDWTVLAHSVASGLATQHLYNGNVALIRYMYAHDFHEMFVRDVPSHIKTLDFVTMESFYQRKVLECFGLSVPHDDIAIANRIDRYMSFVEAKLFLPNSVTADLIREHIGGDIDADIVIACTAAIQQTRTIPLTTGNGDITDHCINLFEQLLYEHR